MRRIIRGFDHFLCWVYGVFEFCAEPDCVLRVRRSALSHPVTLSGQTIPAGTPILELHLWNEHLPPLPPDGPTLRWAVQFRRGLLISFRALARQMLHDTRLAGTQGVGGISVLPLAGAHAGSVKLFEQLGFTLCPHHGLLGRFGEFWENLYTWGIMWAFNTPTLAGRRLLGLRRSEVWMTTDELLRRYGENVLS